jgi:proteasome lid subunit RPN8/RPN11
MVIFKKKKPTPAKINWKIKKHCLDLLLECAKSNYPREFGGLLRVEPDAKDIISEIILLPGTISGDAHTIFQLHMSPIDFSIVGTAHSHPSPSPYPSYADLHLFRKHGKVHIITAYPYTQHSWRAFNNNGIELEIKIL